MLHICIGGNMEKMYYNGREIVTELANPEGRSCEGCLFDHGTCHAIGTDHVCWELDEDGQYVQDSDVVFKFKEEAE